MKKNLALIAFSICAILMGVAFAGDVSAQTKNTCASSKPDIANVPQGSATVVINEVYGGSETGGVYNADFIELYNLSASAVDISDWSVQYYTAGQVNLGAPTSTAHIPAATTLAAFSYYVIRVSPDNRAGAPLPCVAIDDSASFAETGMASEGGRLVLSSTGADLPDCATLSGLVIDRVAWGETPVVCNETANADQPTTSTSVQRRFLETDTDNNFADFNASSAPTPCQPFLAPTAARVNVGGRVSNSNGDGISRALIRMTDSAGVVRTAYTSSFGYYNFADVEVGQTVIFEVSHRRYDFSNSVRVVSVMDELATVDFFAL